MDGDYWISFIRKHILHQQRLILCIFGFLAVANTFAMQHSFEVAVMKLPNRKWKKSCITNEYHENIKSKSFKYFKKLLEHPYKEDTVETTNNYKWHLPNVTSELHTIVMVSFYIGYAVAQVPGSLLTARFNSKTILATCLALTALLTCITPFVVAYCSTLGLIVLRILMGCSEGPIFPALTVIMVERIPQYQRATLSSLILSAGNLGILITNLLSGFLMPQYDWPILFYFFGICCLLWLACFMIFCYNNTEDNANIKEIELIDNMELIESPVTMNYIDSALCTAENVDTAMTYKNACTPWKDIFTNSSVWALIMANIQHDWSQLILKNDINDILMKWNDVDFQENFSTHCKATIPFILNWVISIMAGIVSDSLINNNVLNTTEVRKLMTMLAAFGPKICSNFVSCLLRTEYNDFFTLINCAISTSGAYYAGSMLTAIDLSPNYAATLMAILNIFGSLMNIIAPFLENVLRQSGPGVQNLRSLIWLLCTMFTSGDVQSFNDPVILPQTTTT